MAYEVRWSREALDDADRIADYIAKDSRAYAAGLVQRFFDAAERLADFPGLGRELPEVERPEYRDWIVGSYRLIYRVDAVSQELFVIAVVHGARQLTRAVGDRLPKRRRKPPPTGDV